MSSAANKAGIAADKALRAQGKSTPVYKAGTPTPAGASNPDVQRINAARAANVAAGRDAYSGAGATAKSATAGKGGLDASDAAGLPSFDAAPGGVPPTQAPPQAPNQPQAATTAQNALPGALGPQATVVTASAAPTPIENKYATGLATAQASGAPVPQTAGPARAAVTAYTPPEAPNTAQVDSMLSDDPGINSLMQGITQLLNPAKQTTSLMQDYQKLYKQSGLADINKEIIDAETVINGTEDDVRNEIQTAGGFGTDSQVQAMSLARNKSLLTRYNQLVQQKTDATNQLNTMVSLDSQDKQMAQQRVDTQISAMFNMANFRQQAINNTREQYNNLAQAVGLDGLYDAYKSSPTQLANIEKVMGIQSGGLQGFAATASEQKAFARSVQEEQLAISRGNLAVSQGGLALERQKYQDSLSAPKPQTAAQIQVQGYADRTNEADKVISQLGAAVAKSPLSKFLPNFLKPAEKQQVDQAQRNFVNAVLRRESGAAIGKDEFTSAQQQYFPQFGDSAAVIAQKAHNRQTTINNLYDQSSAARQTEPGQMIQSADGSHYQIGSDGMTLVPL